MNWYLVSLVGYILLQTGYRLGISGKTVEVKASNAFVQATLTLTLLYLAVDSKIC